MTILTCSLILPIRGGLSVSSMNVGKAYYSDVVFFNHAAINPYFNFMYSLFKPENFESQYQFFDLKEAQSIFADLHKHTQSESNLQLLKNRQANIIFVILESFSANILAALGGDTQIAPNLNEFAKEGMLFSNFYANSYRTDRGLVSILSGYPAQPTAAIIKYPRKTESLPSIPKTLIERGYTSSLYYGGDVDFANMRSYFVGCCGIKNIISDTNFPIKDKMTKWGVPDHLLINKYIEDFRQKETDKPFVDIILTLSSHEPFDVPNKQFEEPYLNSIHYTDSCIGIFIGELKKTPFWDNTLVVMVSDHSIQSYPKVMSNDQRFHIPMIWMGGALNKSQDASQEIWLQEQFGSQNDIAASLLSQMGIDYSHFTFSKDMFNSTSHKFAFFSYNNGFTMADSTGSLTFDNNANKVVEQRGNILLENKAKAFFQNMYWDLGNR
ncbi:hypothetical protein AwDysgo_19900 [Bacteroidales bacterium]|nr:hypothetical protein AwDysgo_19900 [Bacteroidales bacterium]